MSGSSWVSTPTTSAAMKCRGDPDGHSSSTPERSISSRMPTTRPIGSEWTGAGSSPPSGTPLGFYPGCSPISGWLRRQCSPARIAAEPIYQQAWSSRCSGSPRGSCRGIRRSRPPPPLPTRARLVEEVDSILGSFADRFLFEAKKGLADLPSFNLDTGIDEGEIPDYPLSLATLRTLERFRGGLPPP